MFETVKRYIYLWYDTMDSKQKIRALKISDVIIDDITVSTKKTNRTVPITYKNGSLVFQTPWLEVRGNFRKTPFPNIYQFDTLFKGDGKQKIHQFYQFIENLETHISNQIISNGSKWFTQKNVVIKSLIRELENDKGVFFIKWPIDLQPNIFIDDQKKSFDPSNLQDKHLVKLIVEISNLWIDENQCGLAVFVQKVMVKSSSGKQKEYVFDESESDVGTDEKSSNIISLLATEQNNKNMEGHPSNEKETVNNQNIKTSDNKESIGKSLSRSDNDLTLKMEQPGKSSSRRDKRKRAKRKRLSPSSDELADSEKESEIDKSEDSSLD